MRHAIDRAMTDTSSSTVIDRINRAIERIDAAAQERARATERLAARHEALRARIGEAIKALDAMVGRGEEH